MQRKLLLVKFINKYLCEVYGENAMSEGKVRKYVCEFKAGRDNIHNESQSGRPSATVRYLHKILWLLLMQRFERTEDLQYPLLQLNFQKVLRSVIYKICIENLKF